MAEHLELILACALFVGSHFLMSHPLRAFLVRKLGEKGFLGVYSLISLGLLGWMIWAYANVPLFDRLWYTHDIIRVVCYAFLPIGLYLYCGSVRGNPAMPGVGDTKKDFGDPSGVFVITRHPMMWGFGLVFFSHTMFFPNPANLLFFGSLAFLAIAGAKMQDIKKARILGQPWKDWQDKTTFWPHPRGFLKMPLYPLLTAIVLFFVMAWLHELMGAR